jgi:Fe-S cluster assembly protein SufB
MADNNVESNKELTVDERALKDVRGDYDSTYGFHYPENYTFKSQKGLNADIVRQISQLKNEPQWMTDFRLKAYDIFVSKLMPQWGGGGWLNDIDFDDIYYFVRASDGQGRDWDEVPSEIKETFDRLGIPEAEQKFLQGVSAQYESEVVYHSIRKDLEAKGVIFTDMDSALRDYPDLVKKYFGTIIPAADNKFAALNSAVWSGGSFIYVPPGVHVEMPLQAYFRINTQNMGQFERTLIIVDKGAYVHYVEGCLPAGELVSKGDKWVNIESVQPGDTVMDSDGNQAIVKNVRVRPFEGDMLTIRPLSSANSFQVTPEHPVMVVKRKDVVVKRKARNNWKLEVNSEKLIATRPDFIPAGELEAGDFLIFPISKLTRENPRYTPEIMRLLGYYLAEGSAYIHKKLKQSVVTFTLNENEREEIDELKALIQIVAGKPAIEVHHVSRHAVNVIVYSRELMDLCVMECGKGAAEKHLSKAIMELPVKLQAHLLETYLKGDGSVYLERKNTMIRAATVSQQLAWQLQELFARQGHYATINVRKGGKDTILGREITRRDQYILYYSPDKQQSEVRRGDGYFLVPVKEINRTPYNGPVFNFELTTSPNAYVTRGFAVHNCTAPTYSSNSLHSAVVEIIVKEEGRCRYTTIQNWSNNVYNLVTKRAAAYKNATMEWVDGNLGSLLTMKYPAVLLMEEGAHGEVLSIAFAGKGQHQDAGAKITHFAPNTTSRIISKSISKDGGRASYRGLLKIVEGADNVKSNVVCDALLLDDKSRSDTYPTIEIDAKNVTMGHEASVSKVGEDQLFYAMSRGLSEDEANAMIVNGFIEPLVKELPMEYALEMNRLIQIQLEGSIG